MTTHFNDAWTHARKVAEEISHSGKDVVLVRDILGRVSLILSELPPGESIESIEQKLSQAHPFLAPTSTRLAADLFAPDDILRSNDLIVVNDREDHRGRLAILERGIVGGDWTRPNVEPNARRVTLYGFKGGVGRSTATFMLAKHLAHMGKCVLVVDLDLESPGIGAIAQETESLPAHGIIDVLVESAVDNLVDIEAVSRSQIIGGSNNGEAWIAPAGGQDLLGYLAKLNRIYADIPGTADRPKKSFGTRLGEAINFCENQVAQLSRTPDVVLLDSRAGMHDIAAVALTQLSSLSFLFAADTPQTWAGYRALFEQWKETGRSRELGERLQMVSSMTPDKDREDYLLSFADHAQECFADTLYETTEDGEIGGFNFSVSDTTAPHSPLPIYFNSDLVGLDPIRQTTWHSQSLIRAAFNDFLSAAAELIVEGAE